MEGLTAAFARGEITPPMGIPIAGYYKLRLAEKCWIHWSAVWLPWAAAIPMRFWGARICWSCKERESSQRKGCRFLPAALPACQTPAPKLRSIHRQDAAFCVSDSGRMQGVDMTAEILPAW